MPYGVEDQSPFLSPRVATTPTYTCLDGEFAPKLPPRRGRLNEVRKLNSFPLGDGKFGGYDESARAVCSDLSTSSTQGSKKHLGPKKRPLRPPGFPCEIQNGNGNKRQETTNKTATARVPQSGMDYCKIVVSLQARQAKIVRPHFAV